MKTFRSIRTRLALWYVLVLTVVFLGTEILLYKTFKNSQLETIDDTLYTAAADVRQILSQTEPGKWKENIKRVERGFLVNRLFIQMVEVPPGAGEFKVVARSGVLSGNISRKMMAEQLAEGLPNTPVFININEEKPGNHPMRLILFPVSLNTPGTYLIQVGTSLKKLFSTLKNFQQVLMGSLPLLLLFSAVGGYIILTGALRPIGEVVRTARRITAEDLSLRIQSKNRHDEIGVLITTLNHMISRLENSVDQIKRFAGDASHDLKTPLTVIRGEIDIALRKERPVEELRQTLNSVKNEACKLERVIDNLLLLSRIEVKNYTSDFYVVPLDEIFIELYEKFQVLAAAKDIVFILKENEAITVNGTPILLTRLISNIFDNAVKYTPASGKVEVSLKKTDGDAVLTVRDNGIGIPEASLPYVFDRFYRVDQSRSHRDGSGLGLSIVKRIADIHGASIRIESTPGGGTTVTVQFRKSAFGGQTKKLY